MDNDKERNEMLCRLGTLGLVDIPFGKYAGNKIEDIPLRYLDETISVMPNTWRIRRVREFVDLACDLFSEPTNGGCTSQLSTKTMNELLQL